MQLPDKATLRQSLLSQRPHSSLGLFANLVRIAMELDAKTIASYSPLETEPDVTEFNDWVLATGRTLVLPKVEGENLVFALGELTRGSYGISEPTGDLFHTSSLDLILVPSVAIDHRGNRLGKGKGYYDRALSSISCPKYGVIFDSEFLEQIPTESHDQPLDGSISPSAINYFKA